MFNQSTAARILDCNRATLLALHNSRFVVPLYSGYTIEQLVFVRILLHLRQELKCRNFSFAEDFVGYLAELKFDDLISYDNYVSGLMVYPDMDESSVKALQLLEGEVFVETSLERQTNYSSAPASSGIKYYGKMRTLITIPVCRVYKHILKRLEQKELFSAPDAGGRPAKWTNQFISVETSPNKIQKERKIIKV